MGFSSGDCRLWFDIFHIFNESKLKLIHTCVLIQVIYIINYFGLSDTRTNEHILGLLVDTYNKILLIFDLLSYDFCDIFVWFLLQLLIGYSISFNSVQVVLAAP